MLETVPCPLCDFAGKHYPLTVPLGDQHIADYGDIYKGMRKSFWQACGRCGFVHQNPRPSQAQLDAFYRQGDYHKSRVEPKVAEGLHRRYAGVYAQNLAVIKSHVPLRSGNVFDVGCGFGYFLRDMRDCGWTPWGVEPDPMRQAYAQEELGLSNVRLDLCNESFNLPEKMDLIISHHAFEHFSDPKSVMRGLVNIMRKGGYFFVTVPTYYANKHRVSKDYMNAAHYNMFTYQSMMQLLSQFGFEHTYHWYLDVPGNWANDLFVVAKYTGVPGQPESWYENPRAVQRYVNIINPLRTQAHLWSARVRRLPYHITHPGQALARIDRLFR